MIGSQLGRYSVVEKIGGGGMADVYTAQHQGLDRPVALKVLKPAYAADPDLVQRFRREAQIAASLHHPNIVTIFEVGEADGRFFIAMRYFEGGTLEQLVRREGGLDAERALALVGQVADALDFAHSRGVLHRDIKPANVLVEPGDTPILTDFGLARAARQTRITGLQTVMGTAGYMSPEQARGQEIDQRSDLYALGVLLYEVLAGEPPFSGPLLSVLYRHIHERPPPIHDHRPDLPRELGDVLDRALAKAPADRFESGHDLVASAQRALEHPVALRGRASSSTTVLLAPPRRIPTPPRPAAHREHAIPPGAVYRPRSGSAATAMPPEVNEGGAYHEDGADAVAWWQPTIAIIALVAVLSLLAYVLFAH